MKNLILAISFLTLALTGCSYYAFYPEPGIAVPYQTAPQDVKIYSGDIEPDYQIIGSISVDVYGESEKLEAFLKEKAAELGADAVIKVDLTKISSDSHRTGISGVAVKLLK